MFTLVLLGPPGAGKGTQAVRICEQFKLSHISTGDMLRDEIARGTDVGLIASGHLSRGELVPSSLIIELVAKKLSDDSIGRGAVLDGFPRTLDQAEALDKIIDVDLAINIDVERAVLLERICSRRTCIHCKSTFNAHEVGIRCPHCGHKLYVRDDDKPETFFNRFSVYEQRTMPIIEYYRAMNKLSTVDGSVPSDEVFSKITSILNESFNASNEA